MSGGQQQTIGKGCKNALKTLGHYDDDLETLLRDATDHETWGDIVENKLCLVPGPFKKLAYRGESPSGRDDGQT